MMKRIFGVLIGLLTITSAYAQSGSTVKQSGNVSPSHVASWVTNGTIGDGGTATDSSITSLGVTSNTTAGFCVSSGRSSAAGRQQLCMGAPLGSAGVISVQNYGTATAQGLNFIINGVTTTLPSSGGNVVTGTGSFLTGHVPCFASNTAVIQDCGLALSSGTITTGVWQGTAVALGFGGTGASSASGARTNLGLGTISTQNANAVAVTGGTITGLGTPTNPTDAATKSYVDSTTTGLNVLAPSALASAAVLPNTPTYANGALGVGATLTASSNTTLTVDSTAAPLNTVVLVKNQPAPAQNGIYTVTQAGSGAAPWVLTRATYFDVAAEMRVGSYTFVTSGATNPNTSYTLQSVVATVGTDAVTFVQFSSGSSGTVTSIVCGSTTITTSGTCPAITYDAVQSLSSTQRNQARQNIGEFTGGGYANLASVSTGVNTINITATAVGLYDSSGYMFGLYGPNVNINLTTNGANGLDTGSVGDGIYYYFLIYNPATNTSAGLASISATTPTLPSGYTYYRRVGALRYSSGVMGYAQRGNSFAYTAAVTPITGQVSTLTFVSLSGIIPGTASKVAGALQTNNNNGNLSDNLGNVVVAVNAAPANVAYWPFQFLIQNTTLGAYYYMSSAGGSLIITGWDDNI